LTRDPYPSDIRKIMGRKENLFRIRVGNYRILYEVYEEEQTLLIINIDKRSRVYR
jgi:mRNA interferase RelE/StbE